MPARSNKRSRQREVSPNEPKRSPLATILKWVGAAAALISLTLGFVQVTKIAGEARERTRRISEAIRDAAQQQTSGDYAAAWLTLDDAQKRAEEGGELAKLIGHPDEQRRQLLHAEEDLAMAWVRNARPAEGQNFSDLVDKLLPVMVRGTSSASGPRKADLLAHIGWAYFLKSKDGQAELDSAVQYRQALALDPENPYANVYWGHLILWQRGDPAEAQMHFDAAVSARRDLPYIRRIELAALEIDHSPKAQAQLLRAANEMRKNGEPIDAASASKVWNIYYSDFMDDPRFARLTSAVPAADQIALIEALFEGAGFDSTKIPSREAFLATLEEAAGEREAALKRWRALRPTLSPDISDRFIQTADAAIARLSQPGATP